MATTTLERPAAPETFSALCAQQLTEVGQRVQSMGNTPTNCKTGSGYRKDDHK